jgi:hypothetical protein
MKRATIVKMFRKPTHENTCGSRDKRLLGDVI